MWTGLGRRQKIKPYAEGTEYTRRMLFMECRGQRYYAGQEGGTSRLELLQRRRAGKGIP